MQLNIEEYNNGKEYLRRPGGDFFKNNLCNTNYKCLSSSEKDRHQQNHVRPPLDFKNLTICANLH